MTTPIRVLVADDHARVRSAVCADLQEAGFDVVAQASDAAGAVAAALETRPDVCLLDVRMPGSGLAAAWEITERMPATKVVMLTMSRSEDNMLVAFRAGAVGYLFKDADEDELADQLRAFVEGEVQVTPTVAARVLEELSPAASAPAKGLLRRKRVEEPAKLNGVLTQLLELLRDGVALPEAARRLDISLADAKAYIAQLVQRVRYRDVKSLGADTVGADAR